MNAGMIKRIAVAAALATGAARPLAAQGVPEDAGWVLGRWSEDCHAPQRLELTPRELVAYEDGGATVIYRADVSYAAGAGVVVITVARVTATEGDAGGPGSGAMLVMRRNGDRLRMVGLDDPARPDADLHRPDDMERCS
jgi:hypothetical protein